MHFSAKRGIAIACRLSVCLSVSLSAANTVRLLSGHFAHKFINFHTEPSRFEAFSRAKKPRTPACRGTGKGKGNEEERNGKGRHIKGF